MKQDVYQRVTDKIVADLEQGVRPWTRPWNAEHAAGQISTPLRHNGTPYSGMNILMLWVEASVMGYNAPIWMTFRQAKELGGHVRKGESGTTVVYANTITKTEQDEDTGEDVEKKIPFMKGYTVFNVEQIDDLPAHYYATVEPPTLTAEERIAPVEAFFENTGAKIEHGGNRAYYAPIFDYIRMPPFEFFHDPESYGATLAHETVHWSGHEKRLNRHFDSQRWGDQGYALEELVAEIGAAFLCAELGITPETRDDHAAYIGSWLEVLQNDKRAIFTAAAHAQRAADFLKDLQPTRKPEPESAPKDTFDPSITTPAAPAPG